MRTRRRLSLLLALATVCAGTSLVSAGAARAIGVGTFTKITTPASDLHFAFDATSPASNHFPVSGTTSLDVTSVDIDCIYISGAGSVAVSSFATGVAVSGGFFSTTATYPSFIANCRLRAVPTGVSTTSYLGSYTGPILYSHALLPSVDGTPTQYSFDAVAEEGDGFAELSDAGTCGMGAVITIQTPQLAVGPVATSCGLALPQGNLDPSGTPTRSSIVVDGHNAYLPGAVHAYLKGTLSLPVVQPALTTSVSATASGDVTFVESAPLMRCSAANTYPPTAGSCPSLVATGITFQRITTVLRDGHQARIRDTFTSTDAAAHTVSLEYQSQAHALGSGQPGFVFPNHAGSFAGSAPDETQTSFGTKAGTMYMRLDMWASATDPNVNTVGFTWSRPPSAVVFGHTSAMVFGLRYAVSVPAGGKGYVGLAESESGVTSATQALGAAAVTDMVNAPSIASPASGAKIATQTTTVKGNLTAGANGLPTSVGVNGHAATITKTSATTATYTARFSMPWGKHAVTVVARDAVGNTATKTITVTNTPALVLSGTPHLSGSSLVVGVKCQSFSAGTCTGKVVVKSVGGATLGGTAAFGVGKGASKTVGVALHPASHKVRVYLYQREPSGGYVLAASKLFSV